MNGEFDLLLQRGLQHLAANQPELAIPPLRQALLQSPNQVSATANLAAALTNGASVGEAIELANMAASVVIHQLGTTGTASREQLRDLLCP